MYQGLCFINFKQLEAINADTGNFNESLLYGILKYQERFTKILKDGVKAIPRCKQQIADYMNVSLSTVSRLLTNLKDGGYINWALGMWFGKKCPFISCNKDLELNLDYDKLNFLRQYTGSDKASVILSYFAYLAKHNPKHRKDGVWVIANPHYLAKLLKVDLKTVRAYVTTLETKGLIRKEPKRAHGHNQIYVHINDSFYNKMVVEWEALKTRQNLAKLEKMNRPIRIINKSKVDIKYNNTESEDGIIFLSKKEQNYLRGALVNTLKRTKPGLYDFGRLLKWVTYTLTNKGAQEKSMSFVYIINRAMLLIREGVFKMPFGYEKYSKECKEDYAHLKAYEKRHYELKSPDELRRLSEAKQLEADVKITPLPAANDATEVVGGIEYFKPAQPRETVSEEKARKMADLERRWQESRYGR